MGLTETKKCPKCKGTMFYGRIISDSGRLDKKPIWAKEKDAKFGGLKLWVGANFKKVCTYGCEKCGYLEFYLEP